MKEKLFKKKKKKMKEKIQERKQVEKEKKGKIILRKMVNSQGRRRR